MPISAFHANTHFVNFRTWFPKLCIFSAHASYGGTKHSSMYSRFEHLRNYCKGRDKILIAGDSQNHIEVEQQILSKPILSPVVYGSEVSHFAVEWWHTTALLLSNWTRFLSVSARKTLNWINELFACAMNVNEAKGTDHLPLENVFIAQHLLQRSDEKVWQ